MVYNRSPTPPPIPELIIDDNAPGPSWFFGSNGGGARLPFGKFKGQRLYETSISYLYWCHRSIRNQVGTKGSEGLLQVYSMYSMTS